MPAVVGPAEFLSLLTEAADIPAMRATSRTPVLREMRYTVRGGDPSVLLEFDSPERAMVQLATASRRVKDQVAICQDEGGNVDWA